ncbi:hypothetical protein GCM10027614_31580 [Micromonospora vulcania]
MVGPARAVVEERHLRVADRRGDVPWQLDADPAVLRQLRGQAEIGDAAAAIARDVAAGRLDPAKVTEKTVAKYLYHPEIPEVDLFLRPSGEERISNFLLWQTAYAELVFLDTLWPDFDRRHLWYACELYAQRDRRFGGALPNPVAPVG